MTQQQGLVLGSRHSPTPLALLPSSVLSACVTHTDGNNFFQLLEEAGEPAACTAGVSLSCSPFPSVLAAESLSSNSSPHSSISHPVPPLWMGSCLLKPCVSVSPSHVLPCIICPCDGNVLVNCITDLLCVYVCLWGGLLFWLVARPLCSTLWSLSRPEADS